VTDRVVRSVNDLVADARSRIERLAPDEAWQAASAGQALIVDIRSGDDCRRDGIVPGSLHIPRTVLEWRLDPGSAWRSPHVGELDGRVVLLCDHGCSSVLAAATLVDLGFTRAGDVVGGFAAWRNAGLATAAPTRLRSPGELPGMQPPEPT
jgi:rhodanese-related sulfurtransferase